MEGLLRRLTPHLAWHQTSLYSTNTSIILDGDCALIVDACLTNEDFHRQAAFLRDFDLKAGLVTHAHWDHFLWSAQLGEHTPRYASEASLAAMKQKSADNEAQMQAIEERYFEGLRYWPRHLLHQEKPLKEGWQVFHGFELEVIRLDGHCQGSSAFLFSKQGVLCIGDHLSDIEPPSLDDASEALESYLVSLERIETLINEAELVIPGHGSPAAASEARERLEADRNYLENLARLTSAELQGKLEELGHKILEKHPDPRTKSRWGWELHLANLSFLQQNVINPPG